MVCYWLARYVVGPVRRLQAAARRLAGGDLGARVGSSSPSLLHRHDEFSELAVDFDDMAARIQSLLAAQRRLIADISHELGSPLTRVNVALGLAFRKVGAECHPELERIKLEAQRLNELIRQLLLLSELENQPPAEPMETINLPEMVSEIAADAEFEACSRPLPRAGDGRVWRARRGLGTGRPAPAAQRVGEHRAQRRAVHGGGFGSRDRTRFSVP